MDEKPENKKSRRDFLKKTAIAGFGATIFGAGSEKGAKASPETPKSIEPRTLALFKTEHDTIDEVHEIDPNYKRMDQKNTIFSRTVWSPPIGKPQGKFFSFYAKSNGMVPNPLRKLPGYSRVDHALNKASSVGHTAGAPLSIAGSKGKGLLNDWKVFANPKVKKKHRFKSPEDAAKYVKRASLFLSADEVGIAPYEERWVYSKWFDIEPAIKGEGEEGH